MKTRPATSAALSNRRTTVDVQKQIKIAMMALLLVLPVSGGCDTSVPEEEDGLPFDGDGVFDPFVQILSPRPGMWISHDMMIRADVTDEDATEEVRFAIDGELIGTLHEEPWEIRWKAEPWADGRRHQIRVGATDAAGNTGHAQISVIVRDPVPTILHTINVTDSTDEAVSYEAVIELTRTVKLDSVRIRELDRAEWVAVHRKHLDGDLVEERTPVTMPGNDEAYVMAAPVYEITAFGRTVYFTERSFEVTVRESF